MDIKADEAARMGLYTLPFHIQLGEESYLDGTKECTCAKLFEFVDSTGILPKTSAANVGELKEHFAKLLEDHDEIIHFTISSALSAGYSNALMAAEGNDKIHVIDSKTISLGIFFQARFAQKLAQEGELSTAQIVEKVLEYQSHIQTSLLIDKLDYMYKGGRCSKVSLLGANLLKIKPAIVSTDDGKLTVGRKFRGQLNKAVKDYLLSTLDSYEGIDLSFAAVGYTVTPEETVNMAEATLKEYGFKEVYLTETNGTDASHGGPNVVGFAFAYERKKQSQGGLLSRIMGKSESEE